MMSDTLRITEIFYSLQGETRTVGLPTVFIRLTGCPLRCGYCDSEYAFKGGTLKTLSEILDTVHQYQPRFITVTGGEPLAQKNCWPLLRMLCDAGYSVSLETSGAIDISDIDPRVDIVMDIKTPDSGESDKNCLNNIPLLKQTDQVKFVICSEGDYQFACDFMQEYSLASRCEVLFSPSYQQMSLQWLADKIIADNLPVRLQIQLHKVIWGDIPGK